MGLGAVLATLLIGAIAGWLAGKIIAGYGFGMVGNIVVGIVGAAIAGFILPKVGLQFGPGWIGSIVNATIGAVILLVLIRLVKRI